MNPVTENELAYLAEALALADLQAVFYGILGTSGTKRTLGDDRCK